MARSKYPPFERKCANHLVEGVTRIVVRSQAGDHLRVHGANYKGPLVPTGIYLVTSVKARLLNAGRRASRYYQVVLADADSDYTGQEFLTDWHAAPTRYNIITEES